MSAKKSKLLIPALAAGVVVASGVAAYFYFRGSFGDGASPLASAKIVPDEALMTSFISTDSQAWSQLQKFGTQEARDLIAKNLQDFNQQALTESNIDFEKDIKPWVGGVMVAILPPNPTKPAQATPAAPEEFDVLAVVKIKDKIGALNFLNKLKAQKDVKTQETDYKGLKITQSSQGASEPTYSTVINNDYVAIAPTKQAIEKAIDTFKGEPSFASKEGASSLLAKGIDLKNPLAQVYLPDYGSLVEQLIKNSPEAAQVPPEALAQLKQVKALAAGIGVDDAGLRMKAIADVDPQLLKNYQYQTSSGKLLEVFPAQTIALVSGAGISKSWNAFSEQVKSIPQLNIGLDLARVQLQSYNLDLDKDIFGWMDGEFAFGAIASEQGMLAPVGFGGALIIDTSDRPTAEAALNKLDNIAKTAYINVAPREVSGKAVTEWQVPNQGALIGHGWLDNDTVFVAFGGPIADAIANKPTQPLNNSDNFKSVVSSFPKPNSGYFYLDVEKTVALLTAKGQVGTMPPETKAVLDSIRGIGMSASNPNDSTSQVEMLFALKQSQQ
ncbi:MAG: DUF3352 domain-containing protein [Hydrococcus sp. Prado102]|jgi:hypothetical protein|nr:DUF3352 domain-containing protein [Hydrococcus sp. Prado102]